MAIRIDYIHNLLKFAVDKTFNKKQKKADIDLATYEASLIVFTKYLEQYENTSTISEYLSVFEKIDKYPGIITPNGEFAKPGDYNRYIKLTTEAGKPVDVKRSADFDTAANHPVRVPSIDHPIARVGNTLIEVLPKDVKIHLYYFKDPVEPKYVENESGDFDATNSVSLEWSMDLFPEIANLVLGKLGVNLDKQSVVQFSELQKQ